MHFQQNSAFKILYPCPQLRYEPVLPGTQKNKLLRSPNLCITSVSKMSLFSMFKYTSRTLLRYNIPYNMIWSWGLPQNKVMEECSIWWHYWLLRSHSICKSHASSDRGPVTAWAIAQPWSVGINSNNIFSENEGNIAYSIVKIDFTSYLTFMCGKAHFVDLNQFPGFLVLLKRF